MFFLFFCIEQTQHTHLTNTPHPLQTHTHTPHRTHTHTHTVRHTKSDTDNTKRQTKHAHYCFRSEYENQTSFTIQVGHLRHYLTKNHHLIVFFITNLSSMGTRLKAEKKQLACGFQCESCGCIRVEDGKSNMLFLIGHVIFHIGFTWKFCSSGCNCGCSRGCHKDVDSCCGIEHFHLIRRW